MMKSMVAAIAAIAAVFLTPALAHAGTIRGTVAAKPANRHVLVVALKRGHVLTARVTARQLHDTKIGNRLALAGKRLADGSLQVTRLHRLGTAKRARLSVVVLNAKARSLLVAGGGSAFSIRLDRGTRLLAGRGSAHAGEKINADVQLTQNGPVGEKMDGIGNSPMIDFSGTVTALDATSITVTTDGIATVVQLPDGIVLPPIVQIGSEVEIVATISGPTLTLATIKLDGDNAQGDEGGCSVDDQNRVEAEGTVTAFDATTITIQPGDNASPVTFTIPDGFTLPAGLAVGSAVEARGELVSGVLTLGRIELQDQGEDGGGGDGGGDGGGSGGDG
ncbi:MAG TPA: hypothetical protein VKB70_04320 [Gaiellaceae bacterium]|nr:hypothetical protein [Gaiellaceae bacterium]